MWGRAEKWTDRKGGGQLQLIVFLAILAFIVTMLFQIVPAYYDRYELKQALNNVLDEVSVQQTDEEVRAIVKRAYKNMKITNHDPRDVEIRRGGNRVYLHYEYQIILRIPGTSLTHPILIAIDI